jgi:hypothetical protein
MATVRSRRVSRARYTSPMPPAPRGATTSYGPNLWPEGNPIGAKHYIADKKQPGGPAYPQTAWIFLSTRLRHGKRPFVLNFVHAQLARSRGSDRGGFGDWADGLFRC